MGFSNIRTSVFIYIFTGSLGWCQALVSFHQKCLLNIQLMFWGINGLGCWSIRENSVLTQSSESGPSLRDVSSGYFSPNRKWNESIQRALVFDHNAHFITALKVSPLTALVVPWSLWCFPAVGRSQTVSVVQRLSLSLDHSSEYHLPPLIQINRFGEPTCAHDIICY